MTDTFKPAPAHDPETARLAVNAIKFLSVDQVEKAHSGHPGLPLGAADFSYVLWSRYLKHDPADPHWLDRDRFVLSAGHGSALLYSLLHLSGYDLPLDELKNFRQWGSKTPGHPEVHLTPGVECTTGPLGQGFANAVGMGLAARMLQARIPGLFDHRVWVVLGDGCMQEGVVAEAASLAGHLALGNVKCLYDANDITLDGPLSESMSENTAARFESYGWAVRKLDGHDHAQIAAALDWAIAENSKPVLLICKTTIGHGAPGKQGSHKVHGEPLGAKEMEATRKGANWPETPFYIPESIQAMWAQRKAELGATHRAWKDRETAWLAAHPDQAELYRALTTCRVPADLLSALAASAPAATDATRSLGGVVMQTAAALVPSFVGGDADLGGSTKTPLKDSPKVKAGAFEGRNLRFGIREHAMGSMANGMALYGSFIPFTATFLTFSDYMRPAIRLAALSEIRVVYVFTHDSIFLGEDGPTHQSVEHVSALRLIPHLDVWRPANAIECAAAWGVSVGREHGPSVIVLSRQKVDETPAVTVESAARGGYVLLKEQGDGPELTFIGTGSEIGVCLAAARVLAAEGRRVRVVSMPCVETFERQDDAYKREVLGTTGKRVSVEAGRTNLWYRYVGFEGLAIGIDRFGASAPAPKLAEEYGLTAPKIVERVRGLLK